MGSAPSAAPVAITLPSRAKSLFERELVGRSPRLVLRRELALATRDAGKRAFELGNDPQGGTSPCARDRGTMRRHDRLERCKLVGVRAARFENPLARARR